MTNNYDVHDLDETRTYPPPPLPRDSDAGSTRSRLVNALRESMMEAQNLVNIYSDLARQLELQIVLVETKK